MNYKRARNNCLYFSKVIFQPEMYEDKPDKATNGNFAYKELQNGNFEIYLNNKFEIDSTHELYHFIPVLVPLLAQKNNLENNFPKILGINFYSSLQFILGKHNLEEQTCTICLDNFSLRNLQQQAFKESEEDAYQLSCSHRFHLRCLKEFIKGKKQWIKCPICGNIYGKMMGDMPQGKMSVTFNKSQKCAGYTQGTHIIRYEMHAGERNGKKYPGTTRVAYIPDTKEGKQVVQLLRQCWNRKLTFTIGRSVTTGLDNQIVWNGIHHKTSPSGGPANFGYPDPTYLKRVKEQLAAKGIIPDK